MSELAQSILQKMLDKYNETHRVEVICEFPLAERERRAEIAQELVAHGYIRKFDFFGKANLRCTLTQKAIDLAEKERE